MWNAYQVIYEGKSVSVLLIMGPDSRMDNLWSVHTIQQLYCMYCIHIHYIAQLFITTFKHDLE